MASSGPAPALAPAQGNNNIFTVATFNVGAKNPESFRNKKGAPHEKFHAHFKSMCAREGRCGLHAGDV